eukprot:TRINITY_DN7962_c0_g1_i3.p1 TRINITY_DN7962_c0_g1~~TRINITY_DN7962_c0_g1_i3.p1  ORF type:complete len:196 (-),score=26.24 TRINITY_DN7962_c0_g1_i3:18-605(-)
MLRRSYLRFKRTLQQNKTATKNRWKTSNHHEYLVYGSNTKGHMGIDNTAELIQIPWNVRFLEKNQHAIKQLHVGDSHSICLLNNGDAYSWGYNGYGQLGHIHRELVTFPTKIDAFQDRKVELAVAGANQSFFKLEDGSLYYIGLNYKVDNYQTRPIKIDLTPLDNDRVVNVSCSVDFAVILTGLYHLFDKFLKRV